MSESARAGGFVSLAGAGPGDPGLLTLAARDRLAAADVVVFDRLIGEGVLAHVATGAELVFAGKSPRSKAMTQDEINVLLVAKARAGNRVVRLKGGDPFVFGRGGEEALALVAAGIPFEVIPGVTSAVAAPAYAGIPVTHRGLASSFAVVTGHEDSDKEDTSVNWSRLATAVDTIVLLMGAAALPGVAKALIEAGRPTDTPAISIEWGTTANQRSIKAPLGDIAAAVADAGLATPLLTVIGDVVSLHELLGWFGRGALAGKRVLVTRSREQASRLAELLRREGAQPVELATIALEPVASGETLAAACDGLAAGNYDWCLFTSTNAVEQLFAHLDRRGHDARAFAGCRVGALGSATAAALKQQGVRADLVAAEFSSDGLLQAMPGDLSGARVLIPAAEGASPTLSAGLRRRGAKVDQVPVYRTILPPATTAHARALFTDGRVDVVTFASSSSVLNLKALLGDDFERLREALIACIGPVTAATARELGLDVAIEPRTHTIPALVEAIKAHFAPPV
jgi:uroporphyrinogen III methyltransferase/synthase